MKTIAVTSLLHLSTAHCLARTSSQDSIWANSLTLIRSNARRVDAIRVQKISLVSTNTDTNISVNGTPSKLGRTAITIENPKAKETTTKNRFLQRAVCCSGVKNHSPATGKCPFLRKCGVRNKNVKIKRTHLRLKSYSRDPVE